MTHTTTCSIIISLVYTQTHSSSSSSIMLLFRSNSSRSLLNGIRRRQQQRQCLSSAVPLLQEQEQQQERPRLDALRQRLKDEPPLAFELKQQQQKKADTLQQKPPTDGGHGQHAPQLSVHEILQLQAQAKQQQLVPVLAGEKKNILTDSFHRKHTYLRLSLVERCNLRCQYCMPPDGVPLQHESELLTRTELIYLTSLFIKHGVDKVRLTGGEPLLRKDLVEIVHDLREQFSQLQQIGMTTNGVTLERVLPQLVEAGLTHVNISLDTLKPNVFVDLTRRQGLNQVLSSIEAAATSFSSHYPNHRGRVKINCVVMKGINDTELCDFIVYANNLNVDIRFIEWMPFNSNGWNQDRFVSFEQMISTITSSFSLTKLQNGPNDTTKWYTTNDNDNSSSRIGFITSMSEHFCGTCNRLRLTADGKVKACLFGSSEFSLKDVLRRTRDNNNNCEEDLETIIQYAVTQKKQTLGGHSSAQDICNDSNDNRPMTLIGG
jgi:cyclic pyranopterin phosphate synthase